MSLSLPSKRSSIIEKNINKNLSKYNKTREEYSKYLIKNLIFHKKSHFTSIFTEYLIWDDNQEFLYELFPRKYSLLKIPLYVKFQYQKKYFPIIRDECGRTHIKKNIKMKKILYTYLSEKTKQTTDISKNINKKYSYILPNNISDLKKTKIISKENDKDISESESTIDNVNANNDISLSLDLKMNKNYDNKILDENIGFVKGKNNKNDNELIKILRFLKPINTTSVYQNNKTKIINPNKLIYSKYIKDKKYNEKYRYTEVEGTKNCTENIVDKKHNKKINSLSNKSKNLINIINKKDITFCSKSNNSKKILCLNNNNKNCNSKNNNIIVLNKYNDYTASTKTNSHNNSHKNKSRNKRNDNNNDNNSTKNNLEKNNTLKNLKLQNGSENLLTTQLTPLYNESKFLKEEENGSKKVKMNKDSYNKFIRGNILSNQKKIIINNSRDKIENTNINNIKILRNNRKYKKNSNEKIIDISPHIKKSKLLLIYKNNNNNLSNNNYFKKQKSFDNQSSVILNNKSKNSIYNQQSVKKNKNIIIVK